MKSVNGLTLEYKCHPLISDSTNIASPSSHLRPLQRFFEHSNGI